MDIDIQIAEAKAEIVALSAESTRLHEAQREIKAKKNAATLKISKLQAFIDSQRPANPLGSATIGG